MMRSGAAAGQASGRNPLTEDMIFTQSRTSNQVRGTVQSIRASATGNSFEQRLDESQNDGTQRLQSSGARKVSAQCARIFGLARRDGDPGRIWLSNFRNTAAGARTHHRSERIRPNLSPARAAGTAGLYFWKRIRPLLCAESLTGFSAFSLETVGNWQWQLVVL